VVRREELLVAVDVDERRRGFAEGSVRLASAVRPEWLLESYSERLLLTEELVWNATSERVEHSSRMTFGAITLEESQRAARPSAEASAVLARAVLERGAQEFLKSDALTQLAARLAVLAANVPELDLPRLDAQGIEAFVLSLCEGLTGFAELRGLDPATFWLAHLGSAERRALDEAVPESIALPSGRRAPIHYEADKPPWLESRLQDFFGLAQGPKLCRGRLAVTLHLLAPNARAVQVTQDLEGFWLRHYPGIRRELMRRYPRHSWPEDGRTAVPPPPRRR
jgi:ATP-dependent helicase HrpB